MKILIILAAVLTLSGCAGPNAAKWAKGLQGMGQALQGNRYENQARARRIDAQNRRAALEDRIAQLEDEQQLAEMVSARQRLCSTARSSGFTTAGLSC